jgi:HlyD family secretion protein
MMENTKMILVSAVVFLVGFLVWALLFKERQKEVLLETEKPTYGYIAQSVTATGTIQPLDTVSVGTQVSGTISMLNADFNSIVKKGQLLAQLDKTLLQTVVDQNTANLQTQRSQLVFNQNNFDRQKQLYATGSISKLEYETALNAYNAAVAAVANAEAQLKASARNLSFADIYSPIDGVVLSRNVSLGQTVAAMFNTPTLFVIAKDITKMQVQAAIDEADIGNVSKGQRATFTVDAFIDDSFEGTVAEVRLQPRVSANVVSFTAIINAPNDDMKLKPGMTRALNFSPDPALNGAYKLLPARQVQLPESDNGTGKTRPVYVWIKKGNILEQRLIKIGIDDNTYVEVIYGLTPLDLVVVSLLEPGQAPEEPVMPASPGSNKRS